MADAINQLQQSSAFAAFQGTTIEESRTEEEYEAEVEDYLEMARQLLSDAAIASFVEDDRALLRLALRNPTDRNLPKVELIVDFEGPVLSFDEDPEVEPLPVPPRPWGPRRTSPLSALHVPSYNFLADLPASHFDLGQRGYSSRNHGSTTIVYEAVDLRPRGEIELPAVDLVVSSTVGAELVGTWTATSTAVDGVSTGQFTVPISPDPVSVTEMLDDADESDD